ncbi:hypothetical protein BC1_00019 [Bacillus phage BC-1]|nr:hypothetical protein BC1_00019 [Bacillus phage BC-1]
MTSEKLNKIEYNNGIVYEAEYDMVHAVLTECLRYTHAF